MPTRASSGTTEAVHLSKLPPSIEQNVRVVQAAALSAPAGDPPASAGGRVRFADPPPDITQDVRVVAIASAASALSREIGSTIARLRARGVGDTEIRRFLQQIGTSYTFALGSPPEGAAVMLPSGHLLTTGQGELLLAAIAEESRVANRAAGPLLVSFLRQLPATANRFNVTIGIGPVPGGGIVTGASFGAGILFAPGDRIGHYGSLGAVLGAIVALGAKMQVTIVHGGPETFGGSALAVPIGGREGVTGGASALLRGDASNAVFGVSFTMDVEAGLSPIEAYAQYAHAPA